MARDTERPADDEWPADAVEVGRVVDAWGIKGGFKVAPYAAEPQALLASRRWFLRPGEGASAPAMRLAIGQVRVHGDAVVAMARDITDRSTAESLRGARVFVSRASFPSAAPDEFYWVDLIGLEVVNRRAEVLGRVEGLLDTGAHSVLRVVAGDDPGTERLIPFVSAYVDAVDLAARTIRVDWGMDY